MNRSTESWISYGVLLALLAVFMPWGAISAEKFGPPALIAVAIAVIGYVLVRAGFRFFRRAEPSSTQDSRVGTMRGRPGGVWGLLKLSCGAALTIGIASIALGTSRIVSPIGAFFVALVAQQLTFVIFELVVAVRQVSGAGFAPRAAAVIIMVGLAVFFAWASNITLLAQKPPVAPPFPSSVSVLFAIPAVLAAIGGLLFRYRAESR
jgi:hypothetical protein